MEFYKDCPDDVLIEIFKNLDLKSRLKANQTCQKWNQLLKDPRANMENVSYIILQKCEFTKASLKKIWTNSLENIVKILMDGLSNHIGKVKDCCFFDDDLQILSRINENINDGKGLKIDQFFLLTGKDSEYSDSIYDRINAIMPSTVRELRVDFVSELACDWSRLTQLNYLSLDGLLITQPTVLLPALKYLDIRISCKNYDVDTSANSTLTLLTFVPNLERLRISSLNFESNTFSDFLSTLKHKLSKLRRLKFDYVTFNLPNIKAITQKFPGSFLIDSLKEIAFIDCRRDWMDVARLFIHVCALDIIRLDTRLETTMDFFDIYNLAASIKGNTKLELSILADLNYDSGQCPTPTEFGRTLTKLFLKWNGCGRGSTQHLKDFFNYNSYEKLTHICFEHHQGLEDDVLKRIARSCLRLETLRIRGDRIITDKILKSFLIYWDERRSKRLSIIMKSYGRLKIDGLFDTSFAQDHGILDEHWLREDDENLPSTSESEKRVANDKHWMIVRKTFSKDWNYQEGIRLVIWDQGNMAVGVDQKLMVIKDYEKDMLNTDLRVKTI